MPVVGLAPPTPAAGHQAVRTCAGGKHGSRAAVIPARERGGPHVV